VVQEFKEEPHPCPYLPDQRASLDVCMMIDVTPAELGALLEHGWRRFGPAYFRPACGGCTACLSVRIPAAAFGPSRSQRRARRGAARLTRTIGTPIVDDERLALYKRWHRQREEQRGWAESPLDERSYTFDFAFEHPSVREVAYRDPDNGNRLVGLGIVDVVPDALSAVYFFWDPVEAPPSLGVAHIVWIIEDAIASGLTYVYLGYRVDACPSLAYKGRYQPQEVLVGRPDLGIAATWCLNPAAGTESTLTNS
jgi:leucyl-tRNA---protein transferase